MTGASNFRLLKRGPWQDRPRLDPGDPPVRSRTVVYTATFFPDARWIIDDVLYASEGTYRFLNTAPSVSFYDQLLREASK